MAIIGCLVRLSSLYFYLWGAKPGTDRWPGSFRGYRMADALLEIWLTISALSSLSIVLIAIGHSDIGMERRFRLRAARSNQPVRRKRRMTAGR